MWVFFLLLLCVNLFVGGQAYKLIMEYVPLGSLKDYLPRHKKDTTLSTLLSYSVQICKVNISSTKTVSSEQLAHSASAFKSWPTSCSTWTHTGCFEMFQHFLFWVLCWHSWLALMSFWQVSDRKPLLSESMCHNSGTSVASWSKTFFSAINYLVFGHTLVKLRSHKYLVRFGLGPEILHQTYIMKTFDFV